VTSTKPTGYTTWQGGNKRISDERLQTPFDIHKKKKKELGYLLRIMLTTV